MAPKTGPRYLNGIDTAQLLEAAEDLRADPKNARVQYGVTTAWKGRARTESRVNPLIVGDQRIERRFRFSTDEPSSFFGTDDAANPQEYLLGAVNACMIFGYVSGAALRGIKLTKLEIESSGELDMRGFLGDEGIDPGYNTIRIRVRIEGDGTPEQFQEIHDTVRGTSPNAFSVTRPVKLDTELVVEGSTR